jgi:DNA polymerase-1
MLIIGDFKALEWNTCLYLSQDQVGIAEFADPDADMHTDNKDRFGLPSRLIAKKFLFRLIFGGTAPAYCYDPEFNWIDDKPKFWQGVIDEFYMKYQGVNKWHEKLVLEAMETGRVTIPTGRFFCYAPYQKRGMWTWPRTTILNYPVQGLGAELMVIARVLMNSEMKRIGLKTKMVCTVHDSMLYDVPKDEVDVVAGMFGRVWAQIPRAFQKLYNVEYNVPCRVEVKYGPNWKDMKLYEGEPINGSST